MALVTERAFGALKVAPRRLGNPGVPVPFAPPLETAVLPDEERLASKIREESIDEMKHADQVISRILFLEGIPNLQALHKLRVGETVKEQLESDLQLEYSAIQFLNKGIEAARKIGDNASEDLMRRILVSEEVHTDWIETQLELIRQVGEQNYLSQQIVK